METYPEVEIPATQPPNFEDEEVAKHLTEIQSLEVKETPEVPSEVEIPPEVPESPEFPMITREAQQAFKDAKGRVDKMDKSLKVCEAEKGKKRSVPKAKGKAKAKDGKKIKTEPPSMAFPVDFLEIENPRRNLSDAFEEVIDSDVEVASTSPVPASTPPPKVKGNPKRKAKAAPKPKRAPKRASPKLKRAAKAKASPKLKRAAKAKASPKAAPKVKAKAKADPKKPKNPNKDLVEKPVDGEEGKKTFARRNCPQNAEARLRFEVLRDVFNNSIVPYVEQQASLLEAEVFIQKQKMALENHSSLQIILR